MRLLAPILFLTAVSPFAEQELRVTVEDGTSITKTFETSMELSLQSIRLEFGDEAIDIPNEDMPEVTLEGDTVVVITDEYVTVADGRPTELVRSFDSLDSTDTQTVVPPNGEEVFEESEDESELIGRVVRFSWDDDDEEYSTSFDDDEEGDTSLLDDLDADGDYRYLLPEDGFGDAVDVGDSWEIDTEAFDRLSSPSGDLKLENDEDDGDDDGDFSEQFRDNLDGDFTASIVAIEDDVVQIELTFEGSTSVETTMELDEENNAIREMNFSFDGEGELRWNLKTGTCEVLEMSNEVEMTITTSAEDADDMPVQIQSFEGEFAVSAKFE